MLRLSRPLDGAAFVGMIGGMAAKLPTDIEYHPDFIADPRNLFSDVLEEFFAQEPEPVLYGGPRISGLSFRNDRPNSYTKPIDMKRRSMRLWLPTTGFMAGQVAAVTGVMPSIAVFNFYRDGEDFLELHSDLDSAIGPTFDDVVVATVSFGAERLFQMRRIDKTNEFQQLLGPGSLLVMRGAVQRKWLHAVPPMPEQSGARLSIVFLHHKLDTRSSWVLSEVSDHAKQKIETQASIASMVREYAGDIPTPVCVGTKEEVFVEWCRRDGEHYICVNPAHAGLVFMSPQEMLDAHHDLLSHIPEDSTFKPGSELPSWSSDLPRPEDFPLKDYPTDWLKEMVRLGEEEVEHRRRSSEDPA